jgi:hypothetical protein
MLYGVSSNLMIVILSIAKDPSGGALAVVLMDSSLRSE